MPYTKAFGPFLVLADFFFFCKQDESSGHSFISLQVGSQFSLHLLLEKPFFLQGTFLSSLLKLRQLLLCGFIPGSAIAPCSSRCLFWCREHGVAGLSLEFHCMVWNWFCGTVSIAHSAQDCFGYLKSFCFHGNFRLVFLFLWTPALEFWRRWLEFVWMLLFINFVSLWVCQSLEPILRN